MKTNFLLLAALLLAAQLFAADAKSARRAANSPKRAQLGLAGAGAFEQVLTDEQKKKLREYAQADGVKFRAKQQEALKLRRDLQEAVMSGTADQAAIQEKSEAIAKLEAEVLSARMSALARVAASLTPEQKEKIQEMSGPLRAARPGLGAGPRKGTPRTPREPAAPPPPEK